MQSRNLEALDRKLAETQSQRQKAADKRVKELDSVRKDSVSSSMTNLRREMEEFRGRMKQLYTNIFQGSKELSIRKNDLIRQIRGNDL